MRRTAVAVVAALCLPIAAHAAGWGANGHGKITWEVARSTGFGFDLPPDVAKVMALGSIAPDFFEFTNPAAHSQTADPALTAEGGLAITALGYRAQQRESYAQARQWHDFYFDAAVAAMMAGQRERAAFLLGYALHNREDFATHRGVNNLLHAGLKADGKDPDQDPVRLAKARSLASIDIDRFKHAIGPDAWSLFTGNAVRRPGAVGSEVPEPLTRLAPSLATWDPTSGTMPATGLSAHFAPDFAKDLDAIQAGLRTIGRLDPVAFAEGRSAVETFAWGLMQRQDAMLGLLDVEHLGVPRPGHEHLARPGTKDLGGVVELIFYAFNFEHSLPGDLALCADLRAYRELSLPLQYSRLAIRERELLAAVIWDELLVGELGSLQAELASVRTELVRVKQLRLDELRRLRRDYHEAVVFAHQSKAAAVRAEQKHLASVAVATGGPPRIDSRPPPPPPESSVVASGPSDDGTDDAADTYREEPTGGYSERDHRIDIDGARTRINNLLGGSFLK